MRSPSDKLLELEGLFRRGSKGYQCAVDVIMRGKKLSMNERTLICQKVGCSIKTLEKTLTTLRKAGLYDAVDDDLIPEETPKPLEEEKPSEEVRTTPKEETEVEVEKTEEIEEKYVTIEDFNKFVGELKAVMGITPIQEPEDDNPGYVEQQFEATMPESVDLEDASMKQMGTWIEAKILLLFDFAKNGAFGGVLEGFGRDEKGEKISSPGLWSDFVNIVIDDYFTRACTRDGPCQYRQNLGIGLLSKRFA